MASNIKNPEVERLAADIAKLTGESKTEAIRRALSERRDRLAIRVGHSDRFVAPRDCRGGGTSWHRSPGGRDGPRITKREEEAILGFGKGGVSSSTRRRLWLPCCQEARARSADRTLLAASTPVGSGRPRWSAGGHLSSALGWTPTQPTSSTPVDRAARHRRGAVRRAARRGPCFADRRYGRGRHDVVAQLRGLSEPSPSHRWPTASRPCSSAKTSRLHRFRHAPRPKRRRTVESRSVRSSPVTAVAWRGGTEKDGHHAQVPDADRRGRDLLR